MAALGSHQERLAEVRSEVHQEYVAPDGTRHAYAVERTFSPSQMREVMESNGLSVVHHELYWGGMGALPDPAYALLRVLQTQWRLGAGHARRQLMVATPAVEPCASLFLTQYFPPETGAAPARAAHFVRAMRRAGHDVHVVTGFPNHPSGEFKEKPRWRRRDTWEGVPVTRVWLHASPNKTPFNRLWNHLSFALSALPVCLGTRSDVILATSPPLFLGLTAWLTSRLQRIGYVLDCRDDWPHAAVALGELRPGFVTNVLGAMSGFVQRRAERVIAVTPGMRRHLDARGLEARRVDLITNGADTDTFKAAPLPNGDTRDFTVLYAGTHGLVHGMDSILDAARALNDRPDIRFLFVGDGVAKPGLQERAGPREARRCRVSRQRAAGGARTGHSWIGRVPGDDACTSVLWRDDSGEAVRLPGLRSTGRCRSAR